MSTSLGSIDKHRNTSILSHANFFFSNCVGRRKKNENEKQTKKQK
jgi:hypothetical protein